MSLNIENVKIKATSDFNIETIKVINNKYIIIVLKHHNHDSSKCGLIKPQKAPKTATKNL